MFGSSLGIVASVPVNNSNKKKKKIKKKTFEILCGSARVTHIFCVRALCGHAGMASVSVPGIVGSDGCDL